VPPGPMGSECGWGRARERHRLKADDDGEMRFLVFYVPGEPRTVWADPGKVNAWVKTDRDIKLPEA
jgi:hypothetical protein